MTIRTDVNVDWESSPRVITVAAPSAEITIQDLVDTCRYYEELLVNIDDPHLINAAGKEFLGGTTYVGITATLQNAVLAFEARSGPAWELCTISGGNLVAIDIDGVVIDPRLPTAYVSIDRTASASATLQEQDALQHSSFNGGVTVDFTSSHSGTNFPVGTSMAPVNNWADAYQIASDRGFFTVYLLGDASVDAGPDWNSFHFIGASREKTHITITETADVTNCEYYDATVDGWLDGNSVIRECRITSINYIQGTIDRCILEGSQVTLLGDAVFLDCYSGNPEEGVPEIDCNGSGKALILKNYNGKIRITNKTGSEPVDIDLNSGEVVIDSDVTSGTITIRGVGDVTNSGTATLVIDDLVNPSNISNAVWSHAKAQLIYDIESGRWKIDTALNQMIFYEEDNLTEVVRYNLFDMYGSATSENVFERQRVQDDSWKYPFSMIINAGAIDSGTLSLVQADDANRLLLTEETGAPGFEYFFLFTRVHTSNLSIQLNGFYTGNPAHVVKAKIFNWTTSQLGYLTASSTDFPSQAVDGQYNFSVSSSNYVSSEGHLLFGVVHESNGTPGHQFCVDKLELVAL